MKRFKFFIFTALIAAVIFACLGSCTVRKEEAAEPKAAQPQEPFVEVYRGKNYKIVYHRETRAMYAVSNSAYNIGTFTLLVNADGTPMLWEGN